MIIINSKKNYEEQSANAFIAIIKRVIFDDEIEEIGGFFSDGGVNVFIVISLDDSTEARFKSVASGFAKELVAFDVFPEGSDNVCTLCNGKGFGGFFAFGEGDVAFVVFFESLEAGRVFSDNFEDATGFIGGEVIGGSEAFDNAEGAFDLVEFFAVEFF